MTSVTARREDDSGDYSDLSQEIEQNNSTNDGGQNETDYDSQGSETDDGSERDIDENQETERRVDDDEDRSNPQYIPKRGTFYEHDDRTAASGEELVDTTSETVSDKKEGSETPSDRRRQTRKSEILDKWSHDKFNEDEQKPKSRDELVAIYGYDIRNEDAPPHARRNRRYGRGPNKYTRTWEDEEAYRRQNAAQTPKKPPKAEDFPELNPNERGFSKKGRPQRPRSKSQPPSNESLENGTNLHRNASIKTSKPKQPVKFNVANKIPNKSSPRAVHNKENKEKLPALENLTITSTVMNNNQSQPQRKVTAMVAQQRPVPTEQAKKPVAPAQPLPQQIHLPPSKTPPQQPAQSQLQKPQPQKPQPTQPQPQNQQPLANAAGEQRGGSKRYSSLRQRPLAETYSPQPSQPPQHTQPPSQPTVPQTNPQSQPQQQQQPAQQQHRYIGPEYTPHQGSPGPQPHPQQIIHQVLRNAQTAPPTLAPLQHSQQARINLLEQQQLVSHPHHTIHNIPPQPHAMGQIQASQAYAPPAMMPAQYMQVQQQSSSGAVFGGAIFPPPPAYPHQMYPHHNYVNSAPTGVTYYSPTEQEPSTRAPRRPTAAIPIVSPDNVDSRATNSSEKDNIDRIVENMFVRKPYPNTQPANSLLWAKLAFLHRLRNNKR